MPFRLKSLELQGYKTFATRTMFEFADTITAIVGPNGSGKSNIADSLRWVLGEQSYSLLRGKKTEDMIFSGSDQRARSGMASATVVFDNSDSWLPIDFNEVSVTRRAYRDGQNEYLINGQKVRLRDISELLSASGLAERTYTVIGQGVVDAALTLKADERRRLFEEAAGIGLHRARREEALRRLETTRRNLDRVQDILAELKPRLRSLERQAKRAQEHEQIRDDLKVLLREWYGYHWHRAQEDLARAREYIRGQELKLGNARKQQENYSRTLEEKRLQIQTLRSQITNYQGRLATLHRQRESILRDLAVSDERRKSYLLQIDEHHQSVLRRQEETGLLELRVSAMQQEKDLLEMEFKEAEDALEKATSDLEIRERERQTLELEIRNAKKKLDQNRSELITMQARHENRARQIERRMSDLEKLITQQSQHEQLHQDIEIQLNEIGEKLDNTIKEEERIETRYQEIARELNRERQNLSEKLHAAQVLDNQLMRLQNENEMLNQAEAALAGYASGVQTLINSTAVQNGMKLKGILTELIEVSDEYETAVTAALGDLINAVVFEDQTRIELALDLLREENSRGILFFNNVINGEEIIEREIYNPDELPQGVTGPISQFITSRPENAGLVESLFGDYYLAVDRESAQNMIRWHTSRQTYRHSIRAVTLDGDVYGSDGIVIGGGIEVLAGNRALLQRPRRKKLVINQIEARKAEQAQLNQDIKAVQDNIDRLELEQKELQVVLFDTRAVVENLNKERQNVQASFEARGREIHWTADRILEFENEIEHLKSQSKLFEDQNSNLLGKISETESILEGLNNELADLPVEELQNSAAHWKVARESVDRNFKAADQRLVEQKDFLDRARENAGQLVTRIQYFQSELVKLSDEEDELRLQDQEIEVQLGLLQKELAPLAEQLDENEKIIEQVQKSEGQSRQALNQAEHYHAQARISFSKRQDAIDTWRRRIEDDFGLVAFDYDDDVSGPTPLPLAGMVEKLPRITRLSSETEESVKQKRAQLRRMGAVNPEASNEYEEVQERYGFLTNQMYDLEQAEKDIREVIRELDELMHIELKKTFEAVAEEFSKIFRRLFGGGSARLLLTDPDDLTNSGIDIEARLPGRRTQGLSLLSGGERSLTAAALIFALLRISPTPFCILDEVDAMLDEANVGRYREMLRELCENTQFIVVTHNRNTVQVADVIYGVTMGRDTASQVISLKLDQVADIVDQN